MKVLMVSKIPLWHRDAGGMERHVFELCKNLGKSGYKVHLLTMDDGLLQDKEIKCKNVKYHYVKQTRAINHFITRHIYALRAGSEIRRLVAETKPDIIHGHGTGALAVALAKPENIPVVSTFHGYGPRLFSQTLPLLYPFVFITEDFTSRHSDVNISLSSSEMTLFNRYGGNFVHIPNGVEPNDFKQSKLTSKKILFVGKLSRSKGLYELLTSFEMLLGIHPEFELHLVGSGADISGNNIVNHGKVSDRKQLAKLYASSYMVVLPSYSEGLPAVLLEAGASGLPVVATNVGGIPDVVEHSKNGILVRPKDSAALLDGMLYLVEDRGFARDLGRENRKRTVKKFSWKTVTKNIETLYKEVLNG